METKELIKLMELEENNGEKTAEINAMIAKINKIHEGILTRYRQDTKSEFHDENLVYKNLLIYLMLKNGIKLNRPTKIANTDYVININSKKLIMHNKSMHINFMEFIKVLNGLTDERIKETVKEFSQYYDIIDRSISNRGQVIHKTFSEKIENDTATISLLYSSRDYSNYSGKYYRLDFNFSVKIPEDTRNAGRISIVKGDTYSNNYELSINENFFKISDEDMTTCILSLKKNLSDRIDEYKNKINKYLELLNEFSLI